MALTSPSSSPRIHLQVSAQPFDSVTQPLFFDLRFGRKPICLGLQQKQRKRKVNSVILAFDATKLEEGTADLYELLGVPRSVSAIGLKAAYRDLARRYHPDVVCENEKEESTKRFLRIHAAYATLCEPESRARYDVHISLQNSGPSFSYRTREFDHSEMSYCHSWTTSKNWETDQCWC